MKRQTVKVGHRHYTVTYHGDGSPTTIWTSWEVINPRTVWSVSPEYFTRSAYVSPHGTLGKKILKLAAGSQ